MPRKATAPVGERLAFCEAADLFPRMDAGRSGELVESIPAHGLLHSIVLHEGRILDGRNRDLLCLEASVEPALITYDGTPFAYVWTANAKRRDLGAGKRYLIWKEAHERFEEWWARRAEIAATANRTRSEAARDRLRTETGTLEAGGTASCGTAGPKAPNRSADAKAAPSGTNRGSVERMDRRARERPTSPSGCGPGSPTFLNIRNLPCCFSAPRRGHSRKPNEFHDVVRRLCAGPRLELFRRGGTDAGRAPWSGAA